MIQDVLHVLLFTLIQGSPKPKAEPNARSAAKPAAKPGARWVWVPDGSSNRANRADVNYDYERQPDHILQQQQQELVRTEQYYNMLQQQQQMGGMERTGMQQRQQQDYNRMQPQQQKGKMTEMGTQQQHLQYYMLQQPPHNEEMKMQQQQEDYSTGKGQLFSGLPGCALSDYMDLQQQNRQVYGGIHYTNGKGHKGQYKGGDGRKHYTTGKGRVKKEN